MEKFLVETLSPCLEFYKPRISSVFKINVYISYIGICKTFLESVFV